MVRTRETNQGNVGTASLGVSVAFLLPSTFPGAGNLCLQRELEASALFLGRAPLVGSNETLNNGKATSGG